MPNNQMHGNIEAILINPPSASEVGGRGKFSTPPMGLAYLASYLRASGISVDVIDCDAEGVSLDFFCQKQEEMHRFNRILAEYRRPLLLGIGPVTSPYLLNALAVARHAKEYFPESFLLLGGPHPSASPPEMATRLLAEFAFIDAVCIGEGERTLLDLMQRLRTCSQPRIAGLLCRATADSYCPRPVMSSSELDQLPFPDRQCLQKYREKYRLAVRRSFLDILRDPELRSQYGDNPPFSVVFSSRGCPFRCIFCCSRLERRVRNPENVYNEIEACVEQYGVRCFVFYDDLFTLPSDAEKTRIETLCQLLRRLHAKVFWEVELRADIICKLGSDFLNNMYISGCRTINIGMEKASNEALVFLNKDLTVDDITNAVRIIRESGDFIVNGTFMFGGPQETESDISNIIAFSQQVGIDFAAFYLLEIHPGTRLFEIAKQHGLVDDQLTPYIRQGGRYPIFTNADLDLDTLLELQCRAYREFYFRPEKVASLVEKIRDVGVVYEQYELFFEHAFLKGIR